MILPHVNFRFLSVFNDEGARDLYRGHLASIGPIGESGEGNTGVSPDVKRKIDLGRIWECIYQRHFLFFMAASAQGSCWLHDTTQIVILIRLAPCM